MPNLDVLWSLPYPERLLAPYQTVTKVGTKGHEDDSKATTDFLEEGAWAAMMSTQTASSPLLGQTRGSMSINQIPEDAGVVIGSHRLVYAVLGDRDQSRKLSSERSEQVTWDLEVSLQLISIPSSGSV